MRDALAWELVALALVVALVAFRVVEGIRECLRIRRWRRKWDVERRLV